MVWQTLALDVLKGLGAGLIGAMVGYVKNLPEGQTFDFKKATPILVIGGIAGLVAALNGWSLTQANDWIALSGIAIMLNWVWSAMLKAYANKQTTGKFIVKAK